MQHVPVNLTNILVIGLSASLFLWSVMYIGTFLAGKNVPLLSPFASAMLGIFKKLP